MMEDDSIFDEELQAKQASSMQVMDDFATTVEVFTGIRAQFIDAGWHPNHAELMVIEILRSANKDVTVKNEISFGGKKKDDN
jgi:hypothetical protein